MNIRNFFFKGDSKYLIKKNSIFNNNLNFDLVICATSMNDYEKKVINLAIKKNRKLGDIR